MTSLLYLLAHLSYDSGGVSCWTRMYLKVGKNIQVCAKSLFNFAELDNANSPHVPPQKLIMPTFTHIPPHKFADLDAEFLISMQNSA